MKVNMLEAKSQLSKLVKAALQGEEVVIARDGLPMVKLVPIAAAVGLVHYGRLKKHASNIDAAFTSQIDDEAAALLEGRR